MHLFFCRQLLHISITIHCKTILATEQLQLSFKMQKMRSSRLNQINTKYIVKKILQRLMQSKNEYWLRRLPLLSRTTNTFYLIEGKVTKLKEPLCFKCKAKITNQLMYLVHLELVHNDQICISRYQFIGDKLTIHILQKQSIPSQYIAQIGDNRAILLDSVQNRIDKIMDRILRKFVKKHEKAKRTYYHSTDIFKVVGSESEDEDSETEIGYVERDLQKTRIAEFLDVNEKEKLLFQLWNDMIHDQKKKKKLLGHEQIREVLLKFAEKAKKAGLKRANLITHAWTLWSFGKIYDQDILECLTKFDIIEV